jgi:primosomal protein N' (replication factor Y)
VLVQTFNPEQPCIALAAGHDYLRFADQELAQRRAHNYPPYQRLVRVILRGHDQQQTADFSEHVAAAFNEAKSRLPAPEVRLLGPAEAPVFRLKGYYRFHFQLQSPSPATLHQLLRLVLPTLRAPAGIELTVDVDPFNML